MSNEHNSAIASGAALKPHEGGGGSPDETQISLGVGAIKTGGSLTKSMSGNVGELSANIAEGITQAASGLTSIGGLAGAAGDKISATVGRVFGKSESTLGDSTPGGGADGPHTPSNEHGTTSDAVQGFAAGGATVSHGDYSMSNLGNVGQSTVPDVRGPSQGAGMSQGG